MTPDGRLEDADFATLANLAAESQGPGSFNDLFKQLRGQETGGRESEEPPPTKLTHTARSALLVMPADAATYDRVMQESLEGKALVRHDVHHFDAQGVLRIWLTWVEVREDVRRADGQKT